MPAVWGREIVGRIPYDKKIKVHFHRNFMALTACGRSWREFWGPNDDPDTGRMPYGEATTTDAKVTCQECLEARYNEKKRELEALEVRIDVFFEGKQWQKVTRKE